MSPEMWCTISWPEDKRAWKQEERMAVLETRTGVPPMDLEARLDQLDRDGFVLIEGALSPEESERCRVRIIYAREQKWEEGLNEVGNMWFDTLLERDPETFRPLVA